MTDTYVHDGVEVVLTGRTALRKTKRKEYLLHEIRPSDVDSNDPKFCKWIQLSELYLIQEDINTKTEE